MAGYPHGPNRLLEYITVHASHMRRLEEAGIVLDDDLDMTQVGPHHWRIVGRILCRAGVYIDVEKFLAMSGEPGELARLPERPDANARESDEEKMDDTLWVMTRSYAYNAVIVDHHEFFRHDNQNHHVGKPGHYDEHHRHLLDWREANKQRPGSPEWVGAKGWPNLDEFIEQADQMRQQLEEQDGLPQDRPQPPSLDEFSARD